MKDTKLSYPKTKWAMNLKVGDELIILDNSFVRTYPYGDRILLSQRKLSNSEYIGPDKSEEGAKFIVITNPFLTNYYKLSGENLYIPSVIVRSTITNNLYSVGISWYW